MIRLDILGGSYVEALPSGEFAALVTRVESDGRKLRHFRTHLGEIPLLDGPEGDYPLYHRITNVGGFQIAGQSQAGRGTWHYRNGRWTLDPRLCNGVSAAIFDLTGRLLVIEPAPNQTSQGYRYIDQRTGRPVTGDETYGPFNGLHEYTQLAPDVWVGQASDRLAAAVLTLERGVFVRRQLEPGSCTFIRGNPRDQNATIALAKPDQCVILWTNLSELHALPVIDTEPDPDPDPDPEPHTMRWPAAVQSIVEQLYAKNLDLARGNDDQRRELTRKIIQTVRKRVSERYVWKSAHANLASPSKDAMAYVAENEPITHGRLSSLFIFDMFNGSTREPNQFPLGEWSAQYTLVDQVPPFDHLEGDVEPDPDPEPDELTARVVALERVIAGLASKTAVAALHTALVDLERRIGELPSGGMDEAAVIALIESEVRALRFKVTIGRSLGHTHSGTVEMIR